MTRPDGRAIGQVPGQMPLVSMRLFFVTLFATAFVAGADKDEKQKPSEKELDKAAVLQAPKWEKGKPFNVDPFTKEIRELVSNEFKFREAQRQIFRSSFGQKDQAKVPGMLLGRNIIIDAGKYDFDTERYTLALNFWYELYDETTAGGRVLSKTQDSCTLIAAIQVDEQTAAKWRAALDKKTFALTTWYRPTKILRNMSKENPHWTNGRLAHDIALQAEVVKFEYTLD